MKAYCLNYKKLLMLLVASSSIHAAEPINLEFQPLGYLGSIDLNILDINNGAIAYRGWFEPGAWQGDLIQYTLSKDAQITTSIETKTGTPKQTGNANWSAHVQFSNNASTISHWDTGRKILTSTNGTTQVAFRWDKLSTNQKKALDPSAPTSNTSKSNILNFVRGNRDQEAPKGPFRQRYSVLGDIIHSNPKFVGAPDQAPRGDYAAASYLAFKAANQTRARRIYVGANDGMLHAFDASNGNEVWAYIPSMLIPKLSTLTKTPYVHQYFVDGGIAVRDVFINNTWQSILVGSLGSGAKGLFALNITNPNLSLETSSTSADKKLMWELGDANQDIGYIFGASSIAKLNNGRWYVVFGNGVNSVSGIAKLVLKQLGGTDQLTISTNSVSSDQPNGLSAPTLIDIDSDGDVDYAYAGDLNGDMWRFDLTSGIANNWKVDYKLFDGDPSQPITTAPDVGRHPQSGNLVFFGTGKLYEDKDIIDVRDQAIYGIYDRVGFISSATKTTIKSSNLLLLSLSDHIDFSYDNSANKKISGTARTLLTSNVDFNFYYGWKINLPDGRRSLTPPRLRDGRLKMIITQPEKKENWIYEVPFQGFINSSVFIDINNNGELNSDDTVDGNEDGDTEDTADIPIAIRTNDGIMSPLTIASLKSGIDIQFSGFFNPVTPPPVLPPLGPDPACTSNCGLAVGPNDGVFANAHIDVDTDLVRDDDTSAHVHEYDKAVERTYVDYFDIKSKLQGVNHEDVAIDPNEQFLVLVANADLSPAAQLTIGKKTYNVVAYQRMIHRALKDINPKSKKTIYDLVDDDKKNQTSLVHTLNQITSSGGTLRFSFHQNAIIEGGIVPTETGCVRDGKGHNEHGRWRNGALTMHLVKVSDFQNLGINSALSKVIRQTPTADFKQSVVLGDGTTIKLTNTDNKGVVTDYYAGLLATTDNFLYESTIFWHWRGVCYGDSEWASEYAKVAPANPSSSPSGAGQSSFPASTNLNALNGNSTQTIQPSGTQTAGTPFEENVEDNQSTNTSVSGNKQISEITRAKALFIIEGRKSWVDLGTH